jgi:hypothetical protein
MANSQSIFDRSGRALGVLKGAARKAGVTFDEYQRRRASGEKWCLRCKAWQPVGQFGLDSSRYDGLSASCLSGRRRFHEQTFTPIPEHERRPMGPAPHDARDGDQKQARHRINREVRRGIRPHPNLLPCVDCGHIWKPHQKRHEYDHYLGYAAEHHLDVQVVCTSCHATRERLRRAA